MTSHGHSRLERHALRVAQESHERLAGGEGRGYGVDEFGFQHVLLTDLLKADEIRSFQIFDQRVIGGKTAWRGLQAVPIQLKSGAELPVVSGPLPAVGVVHDGLPDQGQRFLVRPPDAQRQETFARRQVNVETGGVHVLAELVPELNADVGLVRGFVFAEPRVPIDAHQRPADPSIAGHKVRRDLLQPGLERANERQTGLQDRGFIPLFVVLEPGTEVVIRQLLQELKERRVESRKLHERVSCHDRESRCPGLSLTHASEWNWLPLPLRLFPTTEAARCSVSSLGPRRRERQSPWWPGLGPGRLWSRRC